MEMKPGYKQTEAGIIPDDWKVKPLQDLANRIMVGIASAATHAYRSDGVVMFRNQNIKPDFLDDADVLHIDPYYEATYKNKRLEVGDLLSARTGYPGTTCVVPNQYEGAQSFTTLITRPNKILISADYLSRFMNSRAGQNYFEQNQIGGGQKNVNAGSLKHLPVILPPLPEQRAIAAALSDTDSLLSGLDSLIVKKRDIKQAAMQQLLTGTLRLPGFAGAWQVKRLGEVVAINKGQLITEANAKPGNVPVIAGGKRPAYFHDTANHTGKTITVSGSGANAGYVSFHTVPIFASDCSTISEGSGYVIEYVYAQLLLKQNAIYKAQTGGAQPHIHPVDLKPMEIALPPTEAEQRAIAAVLSDMDAELAAITERRDKTRALKQGMMQELLTGKTRLV